MNEKILQAHFNLVAAAVEDCFKPIILASSRTLKDVDNVKKQRIKFADSKLLKIWCDCSDNFLYENLRKLIIKANK